jgi:DNA recombination protein RmuC
MELSTVLVGLALGLVSGIVATWLLLKRKTAQGLAEADALARANTATLAERLSSKDQDLGILRNKQNSLESQLNEIHNQLMHELEIRATAQGQAGQLPEVKLRLQEKEVEISTLLDQLSALKTRVKELETLLDSERKLSAEKLALLADATEKLKDAFNALSAEALKSNNQTFLQLAQSTLEKFQAEAKGDLEQRQKAVEVLVAPVRETLEKYNQQIHAIENSRQEAYGRLTEQVQSLLSSQQLLQKETGNLVKALRTPHVRGRWGEFTLRRVVELAGMSEHCDFYEQPTVEAENGKLRPDMVVHLPAGKTIVIDSKVPLHAYLEAQEAGNEDSRRACLEAHVRQIQSHIQRLSSKAYWDQLEVSPEFVIMFIPGEAFYTAAIELRPQLFEDGVSQRVIIATPANLIPLLLTVGYGWRQEAIARNAQVISELGKTLYDRVATLAGYFDELGRSLDKSVSAYNKFVGSLESRVLVAARRFKELGATTQNEIVELETIDKTSRQIQAGELVAPAETMDGNE